MALQLEAVLEAVGACEEARGWAAGRPLDRATWADCERADWLAWLLEGAGLGREWRERAIIACARAVLAAWPGPPPEAVTFGLAEAEACLDGRLDADAARRALAAVDRERAAAVGRADARRRCDSPDHAAADAALAEAQALGATGCALREVVSGCRPWFWWAVDDLLDIPELLDVPGPALADVIRAVIPYEVARAAVVADMGDDADAEEG